MFLRLVLLFFVSSSIFSAPSDFNEEAMRIVGVELHDRTPLSQALYIYPHLNDWWLPLEPLTDCLGFSIHYSAESNSAEGFFISEKNRFFLNVKKCYAEVRGEKISYPCEKVYTNQNEIYLLKSLFEALFPIKVRFESLRSLLIVEPTIKLPLQLRREREALVDGQSKNPLAFDPKYPREKIPTSILDGPTLDETLTFSERFRGRIHEHQLRHSTSVGGELLGLTSMAFLQGGEDRIDGWRLQFTKEDRGGGLLGPLGLTRIQFLDVDTPAIPLLTEGASGRGVLFSSQQLNLPSVYNKQDFVGVLLPGWEALLYRNDILIDRQLGNPTGIYRFTSVPVLFGRNIFKIVFFGPQGEVREEQKTYNITNEFIRPGQSNYWFSVLMGSSYPNINSFRQRTLFNYLHGISENFSLGAGFLQDEDSKYSLGVIQLFGTNSLFNFGMNSAFSPNGGKAFEWSTQTRVGQVDANLKLARFLSFESPISRLNSVPLEGRFDANLQYILPTSPSVGINLIFEELYFSNTKKTQGLRTNITTQIASVGLSNELAYNLTNQPSIFGRANITAYLNWLRILGACFYTFDRLTQLRGEIIIPMDELSNIRLASDFDAIGKQTTSSLSVTKVFQHFMGSIALGYSSQNNFNIGVTLSSSLIRNPSNNAISSFSNAQVQQGAVSLKTCVDKNRNGLCEPGDPPIGNLHITLNGRDTAFKTSSDGIVLIPNLFPNQPVDLSIKYSELNQPFLKWAKPGIRVFPRASKVYQATLPAVFVGSIEGRVSYGSNKKSAKSLKLVLSDAAGKSSWTTRTDYEGIYVFEDIPPGDYYLGIQGALKKRLITIPNEGAYLSGIDFEV